MNQLSASVMSKDLRRLPAIAKRLIATTPLPINYEAAKAALIECVRVDEAKELGDRAAAIASYAKQVQDKSLLSLARRIELRAIRRIGELLPEFNNQPAINAGLTKWRIQGARRIAKVPVDQFEAVIEQPRVPSFSELHNKLMGPGNGSWHAARALQTERFRVVTNMLNYTENAIKDMPARIGSLCRIGQEGEITTEEATLLRPRILKLMEWLDEFEQHLPKAPKK